MRLKLVLAALLIAAPSAFSQVVPAATQGGFPLVVGGGVADYYTDWNGRIVGPTVWVDWNFYHVPTILHGIGIEVEGRDLNYDRVTSTFRMRQDSAGGGLIYTWRHFRNFHPYMKFLLEQGSIDFNIHDPHYDHDTRAVYAPGGGVEYRLVGNVWARGDYEYQFWPNLFHGHALNPRGFTIGAEYDFMRRHFH